MASSESERFVRKARAEYDGYLLVDDEYIKESFRIIYENTREMNEEIESLKTQNSDLESRLTAAETNITTHAH
ncbi:MAG: hypothetical protein QF535_09620 [Anaerolineales bacterium]|nr:hypothetical protein [Anaerolineales bacterium]